MFYTPELLRLVLLEADWSTVMAVSRSCRYGRHMAQEVVRTHFQDVLDPFVERDDWMEFFHMLDTTGAGVIGSVARRLLYTNSNLHLQAVCGGESKFLESKDLNLVVPSGHIEAVKDWFLARGVSSFKQEGIQLPYSGVVRAFYSGTRRRVGNMPVSTFKPVRAARTSLTSNLGCQDNAFA